MFRAAERGISTRLFVAIIALLLLALLAAAGAGYWFMARHHGDRMGSTAIGGPFQLVDHTGRAVTDRDFTGRYQLIYFGYTHCPDVCQPSLFAITEALEQLGPAGDAIKPIFITIDPARDTVAALAEYHQHFHPRFSNLTGSQTQIDAVTAAYRVFFHAQAAAPAEGEGSGHAHHGAQADYLLGHTSLTYLMAPDGSYLTHFPNGATPAQIIQGYRRFAGS